MPSRCEPKRRPLRPSRVEPEETEAKVDLPAAASPETHAAQLAYHSRLASDNGYHPTWFKVIGKSLKSEACNQRWRVLVERVWHVGNDIKNLFGRNFT